MYMRHDNPDDDIAGLNAEIRDTPTQWPVVQEATNKGSLADLQIGCISISYNNFPISSTPFQQVSTVSNSIGGPQRHMTSTGRKPRLNQTFGKSARTIPQVQVPT
ncbi:hypothetical protein E4U21_005218 [Claviceps maximensis]|nr:hypothetical protein E4U21_005218 [Claviceps maximensis]